MQKTLPTKDQELWNQVGQRLTWFKPYTKLFTGSFDPGEVTIKWYEDGVLNACYNCLDRHLPHKKDKVAFYFEGDEPHHKKEVTYEQLHDIVVRAALVLKKLGVTKGDRVLIYWPLGLEAIIAMLACARIGAVHNVVFGGFSAISMASRLDDSKAKVVVSAKEAHRGGKKIDYQSVTQQAIQHAQHKPESILMVKGTESSLSGVPCFNFEDLLEQISGDCPCEPMEAEDPLFLLYTSGSTGKPKGILHTTGGYLAYASHTHDVVFDVKEDDIYWCTADIGWITGHTYLVYGPLSNGCSSVIYEGTPLYPDASRYWQIIDDYKVNVFYTAPTALRTLKAQGDEFLSTTKRDSLKYLGSVGEPIDPTTWHWYFEKIGNCKALVRDTWWQTETGGIMISPNKHAPAQKPGAAMTPLPGIYAKVLDPTTKEPVEKGEGHLVISQPWPGQARTLYGDHERFERTYYSTYPGYYFTGDGANIDDDGHIWITGRVDDVLNVSGHRLSTAELENALDGHGDVLECAVVAMSHDIKGQAPLAYVVIKKDVDLSTIQDVLNKWIRVQVGPLAVCEKIIPVPELPKTRSGKVMRRILRKIANQEHDLGDLSTLSSPEVVIAIQEAFNKTL